MAFAAIGALVAGTATVIEAVAAIGTIMTVVGGVTGNKELMKVGGVMSLVGGIGSMVVGAGSSAASATTNTLANGGMTVAGESGNALASAAGDAVTNATSNVATVGVDAAMDADLAGGLIPGLDQTATSAMDAAGKQVVDQSAGQMAVGAPVTAPTVNDIPGVKTLQDVGPRDVNYDAWDFQGPHKITDGPLAPQDSSSFFSSFSDFANKNQTLVNGGMQLVGGAMKGANDREMWDQKMALEQQALNLRSYGSQVANAPRGILGTGAR